MWVRFDVTERQDPVRAVRAGDDRGNGGLARGSRKGKGRLRLRFMTCCVGSAVLPLGYGPLPKVIAQRSFEG